MNLPEKYQSRQSTPSDLAESSEPLSQDELRELAEDIVTHCPSLAQLLLSMGKKDKPFGLN